MVDLRDNPGGLLSAAIRAADIFLDEGLHVVTTRGRAPLPPATDDPAAAAADPPARGGPASVTYRVEPLEVPRDEGTWTVHFPVVPAATRVVLLVNGQTASAAEILAGALQVPGPARRPRRPPVQGRGAPHASWCPVQGRGAPPRRRR